MHFLNELIRECIISSSIRNEINSPEHSDKASEQRSRSFQRDLFSSGDHTWNFFVTLDILVKTFGHKFRNKYSSIKREGSALASVQS